MILLGGTSMYKLLDKEPMTCSSFCARLISWLSEILDLKYSKKKERRYYCERSKVVSFCKHSTMGKRSETNKTVTAPPTLYHTINFEVHQSLAPYTS